MAAAEHFDIVIVGAGPAGAAASLFLSEKKISHLLIDKSSFPRDKICGDALSGKVVTLLNRFRPELVSEIHADKNNFIESWGVKFAAPNGKAIDIPFSSNPSKLTHAPGYISKRVSFDDFLIKNLDRQYARLWGNTAVKDIRRTAEGAEIEISKGEEAKVITAKLVIGADGERSVVAKKMGDFTKEKDHFCAGLRVYYKNVEDMHPGNFIELHFMKRVLPGYFWIFPLPNGEANVGLGMLSSAVSAKKINLKQVLQDIIANDPTIKHRFKNAEPVDEVRGWGLPLGSKKRKISGDNFLLVGDAASLIDPFTGEGIGNAMLSGKMAAEQAERALSANRFDAGFLAAYDAEVYRKLWNELRLSRTLQKLVKYPWLFNFVVNKAQKNQTLRDSLMCMFEDLNIRSRLKDPRFYLKLLWN